ncbi:glycoside hydrolase 43 family protein [Curvibacter sp. CHRR-16]|uniref:glycoside hydrolase family 43 protein n=1 Tax=Curvibacter sp. CHRR-16 TaxID=2835872 RepID=UPI001BDA352D|nr:glycoside hydrolase 43 family protein [Curvibacter sp. CHRR-16]MBT0571060.1 glycoside hydrolase 43 family protein [Curvibacter sp. CHRR-16]
MRQLTLVFFCSILWMSVAHSAETPLITPYTQMPAGVWMSDQGNGSYVNPILQGDYSDVDVIRVGDDYYLTASSFTNIPGLPVLHSKDLVNWSIISYALAANVPEAHHSVARRGGGVWAPAIRFYKGKFHIYYPDPDFGIFVVTAQDPKGPWSKPILVDSTKGAIDPAPFWDDDGQGYLAFAYAASRAGINNIIALKKLSQDGTATIGEAIPIIDGGKQPKVKTSQGEKPWFTTEGPKLYKRKGWYYVFAPAGSVKGGWQGVFRSKSIYGPYEGRNVMDQGSSDFNGPHQGAWVTTSSNEDWFIHFQDTDSYGRRVLLQPMTWMDDDWPIIGERQADETFGQPVTSYRKPNLPSQRRTAALANDEFENGFHLGWQWNANPQADWVDTSVRGALRLKAVSSSSNLWESGSMLTQKLPGMHFSATVQLELKPNLSGERAGLLVLGYDYGWIGLENTADGLKLVQVTRPRANAGGQETVLTAPVKVNGPVWVRAYFEPVTVAEHAPSFPHFWPSMLRSIHAKVSFSYSLDGNNFTKLGPVMLTQPGRWVGAQVGLFAQAASGTPSFVATRVGYADFKHFSFSK